VTTLWTNWSGSVTCQPQTIERPASEAELVALINQAREADYTVRVLGTGHSFVPLCASGGMLISLDRLQGLISTDRETRRATVWGGTKLHQMGEPLRQAGMAMENMGDIDRQAIAGAISTGTHGTGRGIGNISTQVVGLRLVLASGEVFDCSTEAEPEIFKAGQVSLGALGVISQVTLRLLPAYRLHERTWIAPFAACFDQLDDLIARNRHSEFFWLPQEDVCAIKTLNPTEAEPQTIGESQAVSGRLVRYMKPERIDHSHLIFPSERNILFNEMEFALPAADGSDCLLEIRRLMREKYPEVAWPLEYRTVGADDIYLSPAYGRETVTISIHQAHDLPYQAFFADAEAIFRNHHGRPHWGKIHSHTARQLRDLYPRWDQFQQVRRRLDSGEWFTNDYLRSLFD
jgi:FAD/FMN-containing dehydrogenase